MIIKILVSTILILSLSSCKKELPLDKDLTKKSYELINQDSVEAIFPSIINGSITVIGFIFTNCPDICPMTINNMYLVEKKLNDEGINDIKFAAISFDPERDTPEMLKKFAHTRELNFRNWILLTGEKPVINDLLKRFDVKAVKTDEYFDDNGEQSYSMMHTDRISLIDQNGILKKNYKGSTLNLDEIINDIKYLKD